MSFLRPGEFWQRQEGLEWREWRERNRRALELASERGADLRRTEVRERERLEKYGAIKTDRDQKAIFYPGHFLSRSSQQEKQRSHCQIPSRRSPLSKLKNGNDKKLRENIYFSLFGLSSFPISSEAEVGRSRASKKQKIWQ